MFFNGGCVTSEPHRSVRYGTYYTFSSPKSKDGDGITLVEIHSQKKTQIPTLHTNRIITADVIATQGTRASGH